jgi:UDP-N-acetyl-D-galactosamine dehydrogenase
VDIISELKEFECKVDLYDPWADAKEVHHEYGLEMQSVDCLKKMNNYSAVILAVAHNQFLELDVSEVKNSKTVFYDLKGLFPKHISDGRL